MKKLYKSLGIISLSILLVSMMFLLKKEDVHGAELNLPDHYVFTLGTQDYRNGNTIPINTTTSVDIFIRGLNSDGSSATWETKPDNIEWHVSDSKGVIVDVIAKPGSDEDRIRAITAKSPGYSTVTATISYGDDRIILSALLKVNLGIDHTATESTKIPDSDERILVFDYLNNTGTQNFGDYQSRQIFIDTFGNPEDLDSLYWESDNPQIVDVSQGLTNVIGSGSTNVTVSSITEIPDISNMVQSVRALVVPKFDITYGDGTIIHRSIKTTNTSPIYISDVVEIPSNSFTVNSNAKSSRNLVWEVIDDLTGITVSSSKMTYIKNEHNGKLEFNNVKAGTYTIFAYATDKYKGIISHAALKIKVPVNFSEESILMNVGDNYNITDNSNLPKPNIANYQVLDTSIARINSSGVLTALRRGKTQLRISLNDSFYHNLDGTKDFLVDIEVIDGISLSITDARIFVGSSLMLEASVTDPYAVLSWSSDNAAVARVNEDGVVTGVKPGFATITAKVTINGIVKSATARVEVLQSVTKIEINPSNVELTIGKEESLFANLTPNIKGVELIWKTSNEDIVQIINVDGNYARIRAIKSGTAVITAINKDNIVVGYAYITVKQPVERIQLSETSLTLSLTNKLFQLRAVVTPENATNKKVIWSSTDVRIATVDQNGLVTVIKPGMVSIVATSDDNKEIRALCNLTIEVPISSVSFDKKSLKMNVGDSDKLSYIILPTNATNKAVTFTTTNASVVSVDSNGGIKATGAGVAVIIVKTLDGSHTDYCTVTVTQLASSISLDPKELKMYTGEKQELKAILMPANSSNTKILWESMDPNVAEIDEKGIVTAKEPGKSIIIAKTDNGNVAYCNVTVTRAVKGLILNYTQRSIYKGDVFQLKATLHPITATNLDVTWESSDTSIATVSSDGLVSGIKGGTVVITCRTVDGNYIATSSVTVRELATSIKLNYKTYRLGLKKTFTLKATLSANTTNKNVIWRSSNTKIATVNSSGKVTAKAYGYATITATTQDGSKLSAECEVRVVRAVTSVSVNKNYISMVVGKTEAIKATVKPTNATYKTAKWTSSDTDIAIVDSQGRVTALQPGNVVITAAAKDNSGKKAIVNIQIKESVPSTSLIVMDKRLVMISGEQQSVRVALNPMNSTDEYTWSTDNSSVAKIDKKTGKITARATGVAIITVMTDSGVRATIEVRVVGLNRTSLNLEQYDRYSLYVDGAVGSIRWDSENQKVATVVNGNIITRGVGTTNIIATVNGRRIICKLKVTKIK
ncbi:MAG TPA: hypothetical protein GXZ90_01030 [Clostridiales bacterium]|nr:hypothetical protein [Clostridiales bacterium]